MIGMQRFRHAQAEPERQDQTDGEGADEDIMPTPEQQKETADGRRDHRHDDEDHHGQRHHAGHLAAFITVADDRRRQDAAGGGAHALDRARRQHQFETASEDGKQAAEGEDRKAAQHHGASARRIRNRPIDELHSAKAEEIGIDNKLNAIVLDREFRRDGIERRQHVVDGHGADAHHQRHQGDKFDERWRAGVFHQRLMTPDWRADGSSTKSALDAFRRRWTIARDARL